MALKAETRPRIPMTAGEPPRPLPDRAPQFLDTPARPDGTPGERLVVLFEHDYEILLDAARDNLADAEAAIEAAKVLARMETGEEPGIPFAVMQRITGGENPIKVLREWSNLTQADLATAVGTSPAYISQIETGAARGGRDMLAKIADVLGAPIDLVIPKPERAVAAPSGADLAGLIAARTGWSRSRTERLIDSMSNDLTQSLADIAREIEVSKSQIREIFEELAVDPRARPGNERLIEGLRARGFRTDLYGRDPLGEGKRELDLDDRPRKHK